MDEYATLRCHSKIYPNMETVATPCDGVAECNGNKDEPTTCKKNNGNLFLGTSVVIILFIYLGLKVFYRFKRAGGKKEKKGRRIEIMMNIIQSHDTDIRILREKFNMFGLHVDHYFGKKTKRKVGLKIYALEAKEKNAEADIFSRLKNLYHPQIANFIIESRFPGLVAKYLPFI